MHNNNNNTKYSHIIISENTKKYIKYKEEEAASLKQITLVFVSYNVCCCLGRFIVIKGDPKQSFWNIKKRVEIVDSY